MPDYTHSKVYKITSTHPELEGLCYVGSTTKKYLCNRMTNHRTSAKLGRGSENTIYGVMRKYGIETFKITLLEKVSCQDKDELRMFEQKWINDLQPKWNCIGAIFNEEKRKAYIRTYNQSEKFKARKKAYQKAYYKAYRQSEEHKAKMREYQKRYYQKKKLAINKT